MEGNKSIERGRSHLYSRKRKKKGTFDKRIGGRGGRRPVRVLPKVRPRGNYRYLVKNMPFFLLYSFYMKRKRFGN